MKVSVLVPVYNSEDTIYNCIRSIMKQTYQDFEIIVANDGSTDLTESRLEKYKKHFANKLHVYHCDHQGVAATRNTLLKHATGDYIMFVDADDMISENILEVMVNKLEHYQSDVVVCGNDFNGVFGLKNTVEKEMIPSRREVMKYLLKDTKIRNFSWGKLYRRSIWDGIYFPLGELFEDVSTVHKVLIKSKKTVIIPDILYHYNVQSKGSITHSLRTEILPYMIQSFESQARNILEFDPTLEKEVKRMLARNKLIALLSLVRHIDFDGKVLHAIMRKENIQLTVNKN